MKKYTRDARIYWLGYHDTFGIVIYDPKSQIGVAESDVRLFLSSDKLMKLFLKDIVREKLALDKIEYYLKYEDALNIYISIRKEARLTYCWKCKRDLDSVNFSVCKACGWIKCVCKACGCDWYKFRNMRRKSVRI